MNRISSQIRLRLRVHLVVGLVEAGIRAPIRSAMERAAGRPADSTKTKREKEMFERILGSKPASLIGTPLPLCNNCTKPEGPLGSTTIAPDAPKKRKNIHGAKAPMSHGIINLSQKLGLDRKPECPLKSIKRGLHRTYEKCQFESAFRRVALYHHDSLISTSARPLWLPRFCGARGWA